MSIIALIFGVGSIRNGIAGLRTARSGGNNSGTNSNGSGLGGSQETSNPIINHERSGSALRRDFETPIYGDGSDYSYKDDFIEYTNPPMEREFGAVSTQHGFSDIVDNFADSASHFILNDGADLYQLEGSYNGEAGIFEWIVENGYVTHRRFIPGGVITGYANQKV